VPEAPDSPAPPPPPASGGGSLRVLAGGALLVAGFLVFVGSFRPWLIVSLPDRGVERFNGFSHPEPVELGPGMEVEAGWLLAPAGFLASLGGLLVVLWGRPWLSWASLGVSAVALAVAWDRFLAVRRDVSALPDLLQSSEPALMGAGLWLLVAGAALAALASAVLVLAAFRTPRESAWETGFVLLLLALGVAVWLALPRSDPAHWYTTDGAPPPSGLSDEEKKVGLTLVVVEVPIPPEKARDPPGKPDMERCAIEGPDGSATAPRRITSLSRQEGESTNHYLQFVFVALREHAHLGRLRFHRENRFPVTLSTRRRRSP
jgi:hypothetical protein